MRKLAHALGVFGSWIALAVGILTPVTQAAAHGMRERPGPWLGGAIIVAIVFALPGLMGRWAAGLVERKPVPGGFLLWVAAALSGIEFMLWAGEQFNLPDGLFLALFIPPCAFAWAGLFALIGAGTPPPGTTGPRLSPGKKLLADGPPPSGQDLDQKPEETRSEESR